MSDCRKKAESLADAFQDLWLDSDHECDEGVERGKGRFIIHYIGKCRECLAQCFEYVLSRKAEKKA
jgi:hypothetical protein